MQMNFQIRMAYTCTNSVLLPGVRGKKKKLQKGAGHLSFQKIKAVKVSFDISPRDTYLAMFIKPDIF